VVFEAVRGEMNNGYVAIDDFLVIGDSTCEVKPPDATPTSPAPDTTTPAQPEHFPSCDFEIDECGWRAEETTWKWER
jgi:hypothetical protein